ncbi:MAG: NmrA family NAD(P)-binding protein [Bacteroidetes bacterium]|nr:NmrA family NAD(P)-binding protein [Bacteroidota bacterium]
MKTYVVIGATGHTGKPIASGLLEHGYTVRIIARNTAKTKELTDKGAILFQGDISDVDFLKMAFEGADALYTLVSIDPQASDFFATQVAQVSAVAEALTASPIKYVVALSSVGAHLSSGAGVVQGLQKMEELLNKLRDINVLYLRAGYFLENGLTLAGMVKMMGILGTPVRGDLKIPMIATKDIAAVGLKHLLALDFTGKGHEYLLGARDYTYEEIASIYGTAIGNPGLRYMQFPYEDAKKAFMMMGMGESFTDRMIEFTKAMNEGRVQEDYQRTAENTTPTTAEEFAPLFRDIYEG